MPDTDGGALAARIEDSLREASEEATRLRRLNAWLLIASIVTSAATTLVTGITAASGPVIGSGPSGWRVTCALAAGLGFATTVCVGLNQQLRVADRLSRALECNGRLKSLEVALSVAGLEQLDAARQYQEILSSYPESLRG